MGADWVKFRIRPEADRNEVCDLAAFVSEHYLHGRWIVPPATLADDEPTRSRWRQSLERLESLLVFPEAGLHYWSQTHLTDPPGMNLEVALGGKTRVAPALAEVDACRVYVISHNPVFPIEWRDEAYRIILPWELGSYLGKWRNYLHEVCSGLWLQYLHELFLFDRVTDEHQYEVFENLVRFADESLQRTNTWCHKERLAPVRDRILQYNALERLQSVRTNTRWASFADAVPADAVMPEQLQKEEAYLELRQNCAVQIREWNRLVPQRRKVQFPAKDSFDDFLRHAQCTWLSTFFAWCEFLLAGQYGLFLSV